MDAQLSNKTKSLEERERELRAECAATKKRAELVKQKLIGLAWAALSAFIVGFAHTYGSAKAKQLAQGNK